MWIALDLVDDERAVVDTVPEHELRCAPVHHGDRHAYCADLPGGGEVLIHCDADHRRSVPEVLSRERPVGNHTPWDRAVDEFVEPAGMAHPPGAVVEGAAANRHHQVDQTGLVNICHLVHEDHVRHPDVQDRPEEGNPVDVEEHPGDPVPGLLALLLDVSPHEVGGVCLGAILLHLVRLQPPQGHQHGPDRQAEEHVVQE
mmetsp:Transcript_70287/g.206170  ORF Transcript_70287/g.206170 Transcript_70287/m.206170 type:complete len:200 (-) Transcript_70287:303-902(-)